MKMEVEQPVWKVIVCFLDRRGLVLPASQTVTLSILLNRREIDDGGVYDSSIITITIFILQVSYFYSVDTSLWKKIYPSQLLYTALERGPVKSRRKSLDKQV